MTTTVLKAPSVILAATAHELRLPLSHIKGFVSSLRRTDVDWDEDTRSEFLAEIDVEADRLAELIESMMDLRPSASPEPGKDLALIQPAAVVQGALHRVRSFMGARALRLDLPSGLPSVWMNPSQMERAIANLLQNAIKYSPPDTAIGVSARITEDGELELAVEDEGPGVPADQRERIFEPFVRSPSGEISGIPGHGLGLAICRSIVLAHGGRIEVSDRPGGGARFSVSLPARVIGTPPRRPAASGWYRRVPVRAA